MGKGVLTSLEGFRNSIEGQHPSSKEELQSWFDELAYCLMNHLALQVGKNSYRIVECEVYYNDEELGDGCIHPDPYVHGAINPSDGHPQKACGHFYLNDVGGIDLTFGKQNIYAGILIRGIRNLDTNDYKSQVTKVTRTVLENIGDVLSGGGIVQFQRKTYGEIEMKPFKSKRVGLRKKEVDTENFIEENYRYLTELKREHKFAQKEVVIEQLVTNGTLEVEQVEDILGYNLKKL